MIRKASLGFSIYLSIAEPQSRESKHLDPNDTKDQIKIHWQ